jgi:DNA anti-recombination protein RmuC
MQTMEASQTDKRIDDLNSRMAEGFGGVHREIDGLNERMTEGFRRVDEEISRLDGDVRKLRSEASNGFETQRRETNESFAMQKRETNEGFSAHRRETNEGFARVDAHLISINARFDAMHRTMMRGFFAIGTINVTVFLALAGLHGF